MKKFLIILSIILVLGLGVFLLEYFSVISLKSWGEALIVRTPFLKEYVQTNEAYQLLEERTKSLAEEREALISRNTELEEELRHLSRRFGEQEAELARVSQELALLWEEKRTEAESMEKLVRIYSAMEASDVARIILSMEEELAIDLLLNLKERETAAILTNLDPELAARFTSILKEKR
ncbi:MAG TPA: hypothetical protein PKM10_03935 [Halanaerobiales bacterium]|nr:hypothetical protein [Halanaerobiales bacterium]HPZ63060.1 hypothetical protein [Halanaerobiales bacterium]HQD04014.1 hypothetical protein [Halanaerobiales bacterium]